MPNWADADVVSNKTTQKKLDEYLRKYTYIDDSGDRRISAGAIAGIDQELLNSIPTLTSDAPWNKKGIELEYKVYPKGTKLLESPTKHSDDSIFSMESSTPEQIKKLEEILSPLNINIFTDDVKNTDVVQKAYKLIHKHYNYEGSISPVDWYSFNVQNIGTKWEFKMEPELDNEGHMKLHTRSAWCTPDPVLQHMSDHLGVELSVERTCDGEGEFKAGNDGSDAKAKDVFYDDYFNDPKAEFKKDDFVHWEDKIESIKFYPTQENEIEKEEEATR